ncbi:MAG: hypothetical protein Q4A66_04015 [Eubacteriales bacterium]|nr:hypothetical protein [Eubacteriales bacterium]
MKKFVCLLLVFVFALAACPALAGEAAEGFSPRVDALPEEYVGFWKAAQASPEELMELQMGVVVEEDGSVCILHGGEIVLEADAEWNDGRACVVSGEDECVLTLLENGMLACSYGRELDFAVFLEKTEEWDIEEEELVDTAELGVAAMIFGYMGGRFTGEEEDFAGEWQLYAHTNDFGGFEYIFSDYMSYTLYIEGEQAHDLLVIGEESEELNFAVEYVDGCAVLSAEETEPRYILLCDDGSPVIMDDPIEPTEALFLCSPEQWDEKHGTVSGFEEIELGEIVEIESAEEIAGSWVGTHYEAEGLLMTMQSLGVSCGMQIEPDGSLLYEDIANYIDCSYVIEGGRLLASSEYGDEFTFVLYDNDIMAQVGDAETIYFRRG